MRLRLCIERSAFAVFVFAGDKLGVTAIFKTRRAAHRDVRRFPSRQDAESENPLERLSSERLLPRGKGHFFWLLFFGPLQRKVTRPRSGRKPCKPEGYAWHPMRSSWSVQSPLSEK